MVVSNPKNENCGQKCSLGLTYLMHIQFHKIKKDLLSSKNFHKEEEKMLGFQPKIGALTLNKEPPLLISEMEYCADFEIPIRSNKHCLSLSTTGTLFFHSISYKNTTGK